MSVDSKDDNLGLMNANSVLTDLARLQRCSMLSSLTPGMPTSALASGAGSITSSTCSS